MQHVWEKWKIHKKFVAEKPEKNTSLREPWRRWGLIFYWIFENGVGNMEWVHVAQYTGTGDGVLWARKWTFRLRYVSGIYWLAERQLAFREKFRDPTRRRLNQQDHHAHNKYRVSCCLQQSFLHWNAETFPLNGQRLVQQFFAPTFAAILPFQSVFRNATGKAQLNKPSAKPRRLSFSFQPPFHSQIRSPTIHHFTSRLIHTSVCSLIYNSSVLEPSHYLSIKRFICPPTCLPIYRCAN